MYRAWMLAMGLVAAPAWANADWFTVVGDSLRAGEDTVQVNPETIVREADQRSLKIRVNRAQLRHNWDGIPYRSYSAQVRIRCSTRAGEYLDIQLHAQPLWQGASQERRYTEPRPPLLFKDMSPNPTERIVRAACAQG